MATFLAENNLTNKQRWFINNSTGLPLPNQYNFIFLLISLPFSLSHDNSAKEEYARTRASDSKHLPAMILNISL